MTESIVFITQESGIRNVVHSFILLPWSSTHNTYTYIYTNTNPMKTVHLISMYSTSPSFLPLKFNSFPINFHFHLNNFPIFILSHYSSNPKSTNLPSPIFPSNSCMSPFLVSFPFSTHTY